MFLCVSYSLAHLEKMSAKMRSITGKVANSSEFPSLTV